MKMVELPGTEVTTVKELRVEIKDEVQSLTVLTLYAVADNQELVDDHHEIKPEDEIAIIKPVSLGRKRKSNH